VLELDSDSLLTLVGPSLTESDLAVFLEFDDRADLNSSNLWKDSAIKEISNRPESGLACCLSLAVSRIAVDSVLDVSELGCRVPTPMEDGLWLESGDMTLLFWVD